MPEDDAHLIEKITSHEAALVEIYTEIYYVLNEADPANLPDSVVAALPSFDPPDNIEPPKAVAILKAMQGSTSSDKFHLENCYSVLMPNGQSASGVVGDRLRELGIGYHDFWPYLRARGWLNEEGKNMENLE
jgi:hypothetical protein